MRANRIKRACENKLGITFREGGEFNGWFVYNGIKIARVTIPKGRKEVPPGTLDSIADQLKITCEQLKYLEKCPFKLPHYIFELTDKKLI